MRAAVLPAMTMVAAVIGVLVVADLGMPLGVLDTIAVQQHLLHLLLPTLRIRLMVEVVPAIQVIRLMVEVVPVIQVIRLMVEVVPVIQVIRLMVEVVPVIQVIRLMVEVVPVIQVIRLMVEVVPVIQVIRLMVVEVEVAVVRVVNLVGQAQAVALPLPWRMGTVVFLHCLVDKVLSVPLPMELVLQRVGAIRTAVNHSVGWLVVK